MSKTNKRPRYEDIRVRKNDDDKNTSVRPRYEDIVPSKKDDESSGTKSRPRYEDIVPTKHTDTSRSNQRSSTQSQNSTLMGTVKRATSNTQNNTSKESLPRRTFSKLAEAYNTEVDKRSEAANLMNLPNQPTYKDLQNTEKRMEESQSKAQKSGEDSSVYQKALEMLKEYKSKYDLNSGTAADRQSVYEEKKAELEKAKSGNDDTTLSRKIDDTNVEEVKKALGSSGNHDISVDEAADFYVKYRTGAIQYDPDSESHKRYLGLKSLIEAYEGAETESAIEATEADLRTYERNHPNDFYSEYKDAPNFKQISDNEYAKQSGKNTHQMDKYTRYKGVVNEKIADSELSYDEYKDIADFTSKQLGHLTSDDEEMYYYLLATKGEEAAYEYLDKLVPLTQKAETEQLEQHAADAAEKFDEIVTNAVVGSTVPWSIANDVSTLLEENDLRIPAAGVATIPMRLVGGVVGQADNYIKMAKGEEIEPYSGAHNLTHIGNAVLQSDADYIDKKTNGFNVGGMTVGDMYQAAVSGASSIAAGAILGPEATAFLMSMGSAEQKAEDLYEKGATSEQIFIGSTAAAAFEYITEKISLDTIVDKIISNQLTKKTLPRYLLAALESSGVEGSEEVASSIANYFTDILNMREKSERQELIKEYLSQGYSQDKAEELATRDFKISLNKDFAGGFIGGFIGGGALSVATGTQAGIANTAERLLKNAAIRETGAAITSAQNVPTLIEQGKASTDESTRKQTGKVEKLYQKRTEKNEKSGEDKSSRKLNKAVGTLQRMVQEHNNEEIHATTAAVEPAVRQLVVAATGTENRTAINAIVKSEFLRGDTLTAEEQAALNTPVVQKLVQENQSTFAEMRTNIENAYMKHAETASLAYSNDQQKYNSFDTTDDGKTYIKGTDKVVELDKVVSTGRDDMEIATTGGETVKGSELDHGDTNKAVILRGSLDIQNRYDKSTVMQPEFVNTVLSVWNDSNLQDSDLTSFMQDVEGIYRAANTNDSYTPGVISSERANILTNAAIESKKANITAKSAQLQSMKTGTRHEGAVFFEGSNGTNINIESSKGLEKQGIKLNPMQKIGIDTVVNMAKSTGIKFRFFRSTRNSDGMYVSKYSEDGKASPNGFYKNGEIYVDINAGNSGEGLILFTVSHELTHFMRDFAPEQFDTYAKFLFDNYAKRGLSVRQAVHSEMMKHTNLRYDEAYEEVVARLSESFLRDVHLTEKSRELYNTDKTVWEKIRDALQSIVERIEKWVAGLSPESDLGKIGMKMAKENQAILDRFLAGVRAASENAAYSEGTTSDGIVRMMARESEYEHKKITLGMSDSERYEILKSRTLNNIPTVTEDSIKKASINSWDDINSVLGDQKRQLIHKLASEFGVFKGYENSDIDLEFEFSNNNFRESYHYQKKNYVDFTKMFSVFDEVVSNAVGIEVHNRNKEGYKPDPTLKAVYVLISAFRDGENIVPVKLEIKEFKDKANGLYVAIALKKIKATEVSKQGDTETGVTQNSRSIADISIAQLFRKINPNDEQFTKYIPQQFLDNNVIPLSERFNSEKEDIRYQERGDQTYTQEEVDEYIRKEREKADKRIKELMDKYKKQRHENVEKRNKTKVRHSVMKKSRELNKLLNRSAKEKTVKQGLRESTENLLKVSNMLFPESLTVDEMAAEGVGDATAQEQKALDRYKKLLKNRANKDITQQVRDNINAQLKYLRNNDLKDLITRERKHYEEASREANSLYMKEALTELSDAYKKIKDAKEPYIRDAFNENGEQILDLIDEFKETVGDKLAKNLSLNELLDFNKIVTMMTHTIRKANTLFVAGRKATLTEAGESVINEITAIRMPKKGFGDIRKWTADIGMSSLKPIYLARYIGSETLEELVWKIQQGELISAVDIEEAKQFKQDCEKKWNYKTFDFKKELNFEASNGRKFELNLNQRMEIYAMSRREQGLQHLLGFGYTFEKGSKVNGKYQTGVFNYPLTTETINQIADSLSANEKGYAEEMQSYLSTVMAEKGNQVSMALFGVRLFNEDIYWSLISDSNYTSEKEENNPNKKFKLKNSGFTKQTNRKANNPVVLKGFEESWCSHVFDMATYHGMVLPLEDFTRVLKYQTRVDMNAKSVSGILDGTYIGATEYFDRLIADLNGGAVQKNRVKGADKWISRSKKTAVLGNLSVVLQQPSAVFRAMAYVNPKYFGIGGIKGALRFGAKYIPFTNIDDWEDLKKYAPIAIIKEMGGFDTTTGYSAMDYLKSGKPTWRENLKDIRERGIKEHYTTGHIDGIAKRTSDRVDELLSKAPELADRLAWIQLWNAIQRETKAKHGCKIGTKENKEISGKRFNEVVHLTQVYDSTLSRSDNMRSKGAFEKMVTSFMAEPLVYANMMLDAAVQAKRTNGFWKSVGTFSQVAGACATALIVNSLLHAIAVAMRDDDDEDDNGTFGDKYWKAFWGDILDGVNPLNYLPIARDIMSLLEGYDTNRMDMTLFSNVIKTVKKLIKKSQKGESYDAWDYLSVFGSVVALKGIPMNNLIRDIRSVINTYSVIRFGGNNALKDSTGLNAIAKYQNAYDNAWDKGYSEEDCKKKADQAARAYISKEIKPEYYKALSEKNYEKANDLRSFMYRSGVYKDKYGRPSLSTVDDLIEDWKDEAKEKAKQIGSATQRRWSK